MAQPELLEAEKNAEYVAVIEIDLADIKEPIVCCSNDPDDAKLMSEVSGTKIGEALIGSCMTPIGYFRAAWQLL